MKRLILIISLFMGLTTFCANGQTEKGSLTIIKVNKTSSKPDSIKDFADVKAYDDWHKSSRTEVIDLIRRKEHLLLESSCDELKKTYLCYKVQQGADLNSLITFDATIITPSKSFSQILSTNSIETTSDKPKYLVVNLHWLLLQTFDLKHQNLDSKTIYPTMKNIDNELDNKLCALIYASGGLVINNTDVEPAKFRLKMNKSFNNSDHTDFDDIEPRQYMTIYERKSYNDDPTPIWNLEKNENPFESSSNQALFKTQQTYEVIDENSILEVHFDQRALAKNTSFRGNISLKAMSGTEAVEVGPYFVTGEKQKAFGVNSKPIKDIADNYLRMIIEAKKITNMYESEIEHRLIDISSQANKQKTNNTSANWQSNYLEGLRKNLRSYFESKLPSDKQSTEYKNAIKGNVNISNESLKYDIQDWLYAFASPILYGVINYNNQATYEQVLGELNSINIEENLRPEFKKEIEETNLMLTQDLTPLRLKVVQQNYLEFLKSIDRFKKYINYFYTTDETTKQALFAVANMTRIDFNSIRSNVDNMYTHILENYSEWNQIDTSNVNQAITKLHSIYLYIDEINNLSPRFSELLKHLNYSNDFIINYKPIEIWEIALSSQSVNKDFTDEINKNIDDFEKPSNIRERLWKLLEIPGISILYDTKNYEQLRNQLAIWAGEQIFNQLVHATIDLKKQGIKDGQDLHISLVWYNIYNSETAETPEDGVELATATFKVRKVGWYMEATESVLLINRLRQNQLSNEYPLSPSNFKPTAGGSLLWTYYNDHRGNKCGKFLRWLEFSAGVNVSFLDFNIKKDFEVGAGPIIGFFRNQFFITGGYNLSVEGLSPWYWGLGFSFTNAIEKITFKAKENETK